MGRTFAILVALAAGILLPGLAPWYPAMRWLLAAMLFLGFLAMPMSAMAPSRVHLKLLLAWPLFMGAGYAMLAPFGRDASWAGLLVGATPTATPAPVTTGFLGGNVGFVSFSLLASNLIAAAFLPLLLSGLAQSGQIPSTLPFALSTMALVGIPLALAALLRRLSPAVVVASRRLKHPSFVLWLSVLVLAGAKTSAFFRQAPSVPWTTIAAIAAGSLALCAAHFTIGRRLGAPGRELEAGQSLGQKNTMLTLWLGISACGPVAALGPAFYVLWHNLWNGIQLGVRKRT